MRLVRTPVTTLAELESRIASLIRPADLFNGDIDGELKRLLAFCHPDRHGASNETREEAQRLFVRVQELADEARRPPVILKSPKRQYTLIARRYVGDVADIHLAEADGKQYLVKVSRVPGAEKLLDRERQVLTELHTAASDASYRLYFPLIVESFPAHDRFKRRVNVFAHEEGWYSLPDVMARHPNGLLGRHLVWIFKRLLTAIGFAGRQEIVHGAILPPHILVRPKDHAVRLCGWGQSVKAGSPVTSLVTQFKNLYPAAAIQKAPARSGADVHLAAESVMLLAQSKCPERIRAFMNGSRIAGQWSRDVDAFDFYDEFTDLAVALYGKAKFVALEM